MFSRRAAAATGVRAPSCYAVRLALALPLGLVLFGARPAAAFCRQTTCGGEATEACKLDRSGCSTTGAPLAWPRRCLSFGVQQDGSPRRGVDYATFDAIVRTAFRQWLSADCGGGRHPSVTIWDDGDSAGPMVCNTPEYNREAPNANVWMMRDGDWPYHDPGSAFAHTRLVSEPTSGAIFDADVEINSFGVDLTTSDDDVVADLQSIATHEAGHFLGLADSSVPDATMSGSYSPANRSARSLAPDDVAGICALYPPDRDVAACTDPTPNHGLSRYCGADAHRPGCAIAPPRTRTPAAVALVVIAAAFAVGRARRGSRTR